MSFRHPDGRTFTIGGATPGDFEANVQGMGLNAGQLIDDFQVLANPSVAPAVAAAQPLRTAAAAAPSQEQANPWGSPPPPGSPTCDHGARVRRTGTSGKGPWVGWFCPTPKGTPGQCSPKFGE